MGVQDYSKYLLSGTNNSTFSVIITPEIEVPGKANLLVELEPLTVHIVTKYGSDGIPDIVQYVSRENTYFLWFLSAIVFLPIGEVIRISIEKTMEKSNNK